MSTENFITASVRVSNVDTAIEALLAAIATCSGREGDVLRPSLVAALNATAVARRECGTVAYEASCGYVTDEPIDDLDPPGSGRLDEDS